MNLEKKCLHNSLDNPVLETQHTCPILEKSKQRFCTYWENHFANLNDNLHQSHSPSKSNSMVETVC